MDPFSSSLSIPNLGTEHTGNYTCVGSNAAAKDSHTASLVVHGRLFSVIGLHNHKYLEKIIFVEGKKQFFDTFSHVKCVDISLKYENSNL